ncbi:hypothetical protein [Azospirillum sp. Sh1]|uniref:hypothetical protein n=1 Tax=Azospirillum sp. Sh1 TaxID=2607285 RepID=UPI0011F0150F|nr:hypothetical protein [Azospirillum sp. Sh1]KAA0579306.1 hypothetical protein FZ029_07685 [Azospirillum sp. Sh1]
MAISALMLHWFARLKRKGVWPAGGSMLELGPQDILTTEPVLQSVLNDLFGDEKGREAKESIIQDGTFLPNAQVALYKSLGASSYVSLDFLDSRSRYRMNLNDPVDIAERFDILTNFGTSEHIFNIGMSFRNADFLTKQNGIILFILPTFGHINHGFYNIHPTLYFDFAKMNEYSIEDILYIDNFGVRCRLAEREPSQPIDFDHLPIKLSASVAAPMLERQVAERYIHNATAPETRAYSDEFPMLCFDYVFAALRRDRAEGIPFAPPIQGLYRG